VFIFSPLFVEAPPHCLAKTTEVLQKTSASIVRRSRDVNCSYEAFELPGLDRATRWQPHLRLAVSDGEGVYTGQILRIAAR
jgi:hypothetical protein